MSQAALLSHHPPTNPPTHPPILSCGLLTFGATPPTSPPTHPRTCATHQGTTSQVEGIHGPCGHGLDNSSFYSHAPHGGVFVYQTSTSATPLKRALFKHPPRTALHQGIFTHLPRRVGGMYGSYGHGLDIFFTCMHSMEVCFVSQTSTTATPLKTHSFQTPTTHCPASGRLHTSA